MAIIKTRNLADKDLETMVGRLDTDLKFGDSFDNPYTSDWALAGRIIQQSKISLTINSTGQWIAYCAYNYDDSQEFMHCDRNPLVAAMRCFVAMNMGESVEMN